jgi:hypothetical protein
MIGPYETGRRRSRFGVVMEHDVINSGRNIEWPPEECGAMMAG